jgi:hypothetical protein
MAQGFRSCRVWFDSDNTLCKLSEYLCLATMTGADVENAAGRVSIYQAAIKTKLLRRGGGLAVAPP